MQETRRSQLLPEVYLTCTKTDQFRTGCLFVLLTTELKREDAAKNALLPRVLRRGTAQYPDMQALNGALEMLYGTSIEPVALKKGELHCVGFAADFPDGAFVPEGGDLLEQVISLVGSMLLEPNTRGGMLLPDYVESEREKLLQELQGAADYKASYAAKQLRSKMCQGERYAVDRLGEENQARSIGYQGLTKHYRRILAKARLEIYCCSSADFERVARAVRSAFSALPRGDVGALTPTQILCTPKQGKVRRFTEEMDVAQARLVMGYRLGEGMQHPDHAAIAIFHMLLGGSANSMLFRQLRQEKGLCYSVSASADRHKGVLFLSAGVEAEKLPEAEAAMREVVAKIADGAFTEEMLEASKRELINHLRLSADQPGGLGVQWLDLKLLALEYTPEEWIGLLDCVTKAQVAAVAADVREDAVYWLRKAPDEKEGML